MTNDRRIRVKTRNVEEHVRIPSLRTSLFAAQSLTLHNCSTRSYKITNARGDTAIEFTILLYMPQIFNPRVRINSASLNKTL